MSEGALFPLPGMGPYVSGLPHYLYPLSPTLGSPGGRSERRRSQEVAWERPQEQRDKLREQARSRSVSFVEPGLSIDED